MRVQRLLPLVKFSILPYGALCRERRRGLTVLIYHRVGGGSGSEIDLPANLFERQMVYLRDNYTIVSMDRLLQEPPSFAEVYDCAVVTFDDGYLETYTNAFPILKRYGIPATVYLATRYVETGKPFDFGGSRAVVPAPRPLGWPDVRAMVDSGLITVGSHTHNHLNLGRVPLDVVRRELALSSRVIEERLGVRPVHFAYPWGVVTPEVKSVVGEYFKTAVAGGTGKNIPGAVDLLALKRIPVQRSDGFGLFRLKLRSFLDGEEFFRALARRWAGAS